MIVGPAALVGALRRLEDACEGVVGQVALRAAGDLAGQPDGLKLRQQSAEVSSTWIMRLTVLPEIPCRASITSRCASTWARS